MWVLHRSVLGDRSCGSHQRLSPRARSNYGEAIESESVKTEIWLGRRDSNPDYTVQSRVSYH